MKLTRDDTRDLAIRILDELVKNGLVKDCTDTNDQTEFDVQDTIEDVLIETFGLRVKSE